MTDNPKKQQMSYEPLKSILANMDLKTRNKIRLYMPSLQKTNAMVPYTFDSVHITNCAIFKVDDRKWDFPRKGFRDNKHTKHYISGPQIRRRSVMKEVENMEDLGLLYTKLALNYLREETKIGHLVYEDMPKEMEDHKLKIQVSKLTLLPFDTAGYANVEKFHKIFPFIKDSTPLKKVVMEVTPGTRPLIDLPLIKTCTSLSLKYHEDRNEPLGDLLYQLENKHIHLEYDHIEVGLIVNLAKHWIAIKKPLGSSFTAPNPNFLFITDTLLTLKSQLDAETSKISELGNDLFARCAIIPLTETTEIVAYGVRYRDEEGEDKIFELALKMVVKPKGSTNASKFFNNS